MARMAPAPVTRPKSEPALVELVETPQTIPAAVPPPIPPPSVLEHGSVVPRPLKEGVLVRFVICQLMLRLWRRSGPKRNVFASDMFQLNIQGPSTAPRGSSPYVRLSLASVGRVMTSETPVWKKWEGAPPQMLRLGSAIKFGRREKVAPVPLSEATPPRRTVSGVPVCQVTMF